MSDENIALVTGATGYIAKHVVLELLKSGYRVRGSLRSMHRADEVRNAVRPHLDPAFDLDAALSFVELDLNRDAGWTTALEGIDVLLHTASPFPIQLPDDENELIRPAVDGTLRALNAAQTTGVKRVILTSSTAAVTYRDAPADGVEFNEVDWTDVDHLTCLSYAKSKTLAERAAWSFVDTETAGFELTTINPGFVLGPPLDKTIGTSMQVITRLLSARDPALPNLGFATVDVRDVAKMHVRAIDRSATHGLRILAVSGFIWFQDLARAIKTAFPKTENCHPCGARLAD